MTKRELDNIEEAFYTFLRLTIRKKVIKIEYHRIKNSKGTFDIAFIGYETQNGGLHGIHYNGQYHSYSFGTRGRDDAWRTVLTAPQEQKIPRNLKDLFREVVNSKKSIKIINYGKRANDRKTPN